MSQPTLQQAFELAVKHYHAGRLTEAEQIGQQILAQYPNQLETVQLMGMLAHQLKKTEIAIDFMKRAIALSPNQAIAHHNLALVLNAAGRFDEAIDSSRRAVALNPNLQEAHNNLGFALASRGDFTQALAAFQRAISLRPDCAGTLFNLGNTFYSLGRYQEAIETHRHAIALDPGNVDTLESLGNALNKCGRSDEAIATLEIAVKKNPNSASANNSLADAFKDRGMLDEAVGGFRKAVALNAKLVEAHSNLLFVLNYHPDADAQQIAREARGWHQQHAQHLEKIVRADAHFANAPDPDRRLRIGYVSADFWEHASAYFLLPLFSHHDRLQVEVFCYAELLRPDGATSHLQQQADHWQMTVGMSDQRLAEQIQEDRIDILVDLKLHTARNRLLVFTRKPAPVQVTWLGYPGSTGLTEIDYRLSDPYLDPVGMDESIYSEKTFRLPDTFWCYDPFDTRDVPVNPLPALSDTGGGNRPITFGCLNNFCKINDRVLSLWARVLGQVENSRLLLLAPEGTVRQRTLDKLKQEGIDPARIAFTTRSSRRDYLLQYHNTDLCLDTFPYNGHTTSLDSFWMGVPVVTLVGQTAVSRAGLSQLSNLGMRQLAAQTPEQFVEIAVALARDLPRLQGIRASLRSTMRCSPLMDGARFAHNVEAAYRQMWRAWCFSVTRNTSDVSQKHHPA